MIFDLNWSNRFEIGGWENPSVRLDILRFAIYDGFPRWLSMISCPRNMSFQTCEKEEVMEMLRKEGLWQYFSKKMQESKQLELVVNLRTIFATRAWLKIWMSQNHKPPKILGLVRGSQETHQIFLVPSFEFHQKLVSIDCIFLHRHTCS